MALPVPVLYEDDDLLIFDKPAGLLVIPAPRKEQPTLTEVANAQCPGPRRLYPCHRLDRQTSGVIIFAKGKRPQQRMMELFRQRAVAKTYLAFVRGVILKPSGVIRRPVQDPYRARPRGHRPANQDPGQPAVTRYEVCASSGAVSVIKAYPETGRKNQIRIHFSQLGHPLLGERVYAFRRDFPLDFRRLALHAWSVRFTCPGTRKVISVTAPLPADMAEFLSEQHLAVS